MNLPQRIAGTVDRRARGLAFRPSVCLCSCRLPVDAVALCFLEVPSILRDERRGMLRIRLQDVAKTTDREVLKNPLRTIHVSAGAIQGQSTVCVRRARTITQLLEDIERRHAGSPLTSYSGLAIETPAPVA
ncbi:MAG: hypothetical protein A2W26_07950 [Acidobacteria bacterium RBG_16_64_8]|nr:MAG: hypothetical protein A2W26_07950 [Acidobacteria bacterium RBG_16_64_8]